MRVRGWCCRKGVKLHASTSVDSGSRAQRRSARVAVSQAQGHYGRREVRSQPKRDANAPLRLARHGNRAAVGHLASLRQAGPRSRHVGEGGRRGIEVGVARLLCIRWAWLARKTREGGSIRLYMPVEHSTADSRCDQYSSGVRSGEGRIGCGHGDRGGDRLGETGTCCPMDAARRLSRSSQVEAKRGPRQAARKHLRAACLTSRHSPIRIHCMVSYYQTARWAKPRTCSASAHPRRVGHVIPTGGVVGAHGKVRYVRAHRLESRRGEREGCRQREGSRRGGGGRGRSERC
ncbi:hypothetical protein BD626DRAFT_491971 [Schizophyllum amplum]|uniref:Uncharacterized protein n=1 Tax=Schizophyllum amplum TaxID=97359 RepID=A0A550CI48_9AGAR|nr:hypothetical protein BD626DRAFT_491971 [Auriculariopsis ampla]